MNLIAPDGKIFFTEGELKCKDSGKLILHPKFAKELINLRIAYSEPMVVNSCCRAEYYNNKVGGSLSSYHICDDERGGSCAIDIRLDEPNLGKLTRFALCGGWSIIYYDTFVHLDARSICHDQIPYFKIKKG